MYWGNKRMTGYAAFQVVKADLLERVRKFSFLVLCAAAVFLAVLSVPDVDAPIVSIAIEPGIFKQGANASWMPMAIGLWGGLVFPMIGFSYVKNNIAMDRKSGMLYSIQAMGMKKSNYVIGKFVSNLIVLTIMWALVIAGAAAMLPLGFPHEGIGFYDFISPFLSLYPGIFFASAFAVFLESISAIHHKNGNGLGIIFLFVLFLISYGNGDTNNSILRLFDISSYQWVMDSINAAVIPILSRPVQETGILVPGGMFAGSSDEKDLVFHGLIKSIPYLLEKSFLILFSLFLVLLSIGFLESAERKQKVTIKRQKREEKPKGVSRCYRGLFANEIKIIVREYSRGFWIFLLCLWMCCFFLPAKAVAGYVWILLLILSVLVFSQMGSRDYENGLAEYFTTFRTSFGKQMGYTYLSGVLYLMWLSLPVIGKTLITQGIPSAIGYLLFPFFLPALACFLGKFLRSRRPFETVYFLFCFLLMNQPSFLLSGSMMAFMAIGTWILLFALFLFPIYKSTNGKNVHI